MNGEAGDRSVVYARLREAFPPPYVSQLWRFRATFTNSYPLLAGNRQDGTAGKPQPSNYVRRPELSPALCRKPLRALRRDALMQVWKRHCQALRSAFTQSFTACILFAPHDLS